MVDRNLSSERPEKEREGEATRGVPDKKSKSESNKIRRTGGEKHGTPMRNTTANDQVSCKNLHSRRWKAEPQGQTGRTKTYLQARAKPSAWTTQAIV